MFQSRQQRNDRMHTAHRIAHPADYQWEIFIARQPGQPTRLFNRHREPGTIPPRTVEPERGHTHHDDLGIDLAHRFPAEAKVFHHPRREVFDHDVRFFNQLLQQRQTFRTVELEGDTAFARIGAGEDRRPFPHLLDGSGTGKAHAVGALNGFDLEHIGTHV